MRELENYINDVERYIGNFESVISDIENSHYIDIMVEENNEKVKKYADIGKKIIDFEKYVY